MPKRPKMKFVHLLFYITAFTGITAQAKTITRNLGPIETNIPISLEWDADKKLGIAWIDVEIGPTHGANDDTPDYDVHRTRISGLSYNTRTRELTYEDGKISAVCAKNTGGFFGRFKATGQCRVDYNIMKDSGSYTGHSLIIILRIKE